MSRRPMRSGGQGGGCGYRGGSSRGEIRIYLFGLGVGLGLLQF